MTLYAVFWFFLLYAVLGWCAEVSYAAVTVGRFVNRGFLDGPYCPVYGFGVVLVLLILKPVSEHFVPLFIGSVLLTTALEFLAGFCLERIFHEKWWDYSDLPFNVRGYICPKFSLMWGTACVLVVRVIHPAVEKLTALLPVGVGIVCLCAAYGLLLTDLIGTVVRLAKFRRTLRSVEHINEELHRLSDSVGEKISDGVLRGAAVGADVQEKLSENRAHRVKERQKRQERAAQLREALSVERRRMSGHTSRRIQRAFPKLYERLQERAQRHEDGKK